MKKIIWLDDGFDCMEDDSRTIKETMVNELDVILCDGSKVPSTVRLSSDRCVYDFKNVTEKYLAQPAEVAGFILDVRIPVNDLSILGLPDIITQSGLYTGLRIARHYLRSQASVGRAFMETPVLFLTVAGTLAEDGEDFSWYSRDGRYEHIDKTDEYYCKAVQQWLRSL